MFSKIWQSSLSYEVSSRGLRKCSCFNDDAEGNLPSISIGPVHFQIMDCQISPRAKPHLNGVSLAMVAQH